MHLLYPAPAAADMPLHPSLTKDPTQGRTTPIVGQAAKRPSVLKPSASKRQHMPSPLQVGRICVLHQRAEEFVKIIEDCVEP
eukprot:915258-Pelagomonas_calceolata.AAC.2